MVYFFCSSIFFQLYIKKNLKKNRISYYKTMFLFFDNIQEYTEKSLLGVKHFFKKTMCEPIFRKKKILLKKRRDS